MGKWVDFNDFKGLERSGWKKKRRGGYDRAQKRAFARGPTLF
jgi:hypothetical protein